MKPLGVELVNFACFDRQFVPFRPGVNLVVGRNNSGKTAILRGLSALQALPLGTAVRSFPTDLTGYCRDSSTRFGLEILYRIEETDSNSIFFRAPQDWLARVYEQGVARWRFTATQQPPLIFQDCVLELPATTSGAERAALVVTNPNCVVNTLRFPDLSNAGGRQITNRNAAANVPMFDMGNQYSAPLEIFHHIRLVHPHRVVYPIQPLQAAYELPGDAQNLAQFLQTLQGKDRDIFQAIERFVIQVFPEFRYINPVSTPGNQVSLVLTESSSGRNIPLANSGTGVEQMLALAAFVLTTPKNALILLDEPHSYLHPSAERALVQFLRDHEEHTYFISTHSAILINSFESDRIIHVDPPGRPYALSPDTKDTSKALFDLGYRNSDLLFNDRLIIVEGPSDKEILPILLLADGELSQSDLNRTGFPILDGIGKGSTSIQTAILRYEKLLNAIGRASQPHLYLLDGDRRGDEKTVIEGTTNPMTGVRITVQFLPRLEIENYLLAPDAISAAIQEELALGCPEPQTGAVNVSRVLEALLESDNQRLFPNGKTQNQGRELNLKQVKGSLLLEEIYDKAGLQYNKKRSGALIAKRIAAKNQPALSELTDLVRSIFRT